MKKLINEIITMIENQMKVPDRTYLLKLEDFDTPVIYMEICKHFSSKSGLKFISNLEYSKFTYFKEKNKPEWIPALEYLTDNGYAKNEPLTFFRNQAAASNTGTTLFLLMGAETALDRGSLKDFTHISMNDIVERLKKDYSISESTKLHRLKVSAIMQSSVFHWQNLLTIRTSTKTEKSLWRLISVSYQIYLTWLFMMSRNL